jgi:hypothetical protein
MKDANKKKRGDPWKMVKIDLDAFRDATASGFLSLEEVASFPACNNTVLCLWTGDSLAANLPILPESPGGREQSRAAAR